MKHTFENYIKNSTYEKRVWWWPAKWFIKPYALSLKDWKDEAVFFKKHYPVQYFLRDIIWDYRYRINYTFKELKYNIKGRIINPRKEMRDKVFPHRWNDLSHSIVTFHLEAIIEFVDREKCFEHINYDSDSFHKDFANGLRECYDYAKRVRPQWEKDLDEAYGRVEHDGEYKVVYKEVNEIEAKIDEFDTKVCEWVIENRAYFWC